MIDYSSSRAVTSRALSDFAKLESLSDPHCQSVIVAMQKVLEEKNENHRNFEVPTRRELNRVTLCLLANADQDHVRQWQKLSTAFTYELPNLAMLKDGPGDSENTSPRTIFILTPTQWFSKIMHRFSEDPITKELLRELRTSAKEYESSGHSELGPLNDMRFYLKLLKIIAQQHVGNEKKHQILTQIAKVDLRVQREIPRICNRDACFERVRMPSWLGIDGD